MGVKLLLPIQLERQFDREGARVPPAGPFDKQNLIRSLEWRANRYDLANARLKACAAEGKSPTLAGLFEPRRPLRDALATLRQRGISSSSCRLFHRALQRAQRRSARSGRFPAAVLAVYRAHNQAAFDRSIAQAKDRGARVVRRVVESATHTPPKPTDCGPWEGATERRVFSRSDSHRAQPAACPPP